MKIKVSGGTKEQNELIEKLFEHEWPKIEPIYFQVFKDLFFKEMRTGIEITKKEIEDGALEVLKRSGLYNRLASNSEAE